MKRRLIVFMMVIVMLAGCEGAKAIREGRLRDTLFSIERHANGAASIWVTHDDVGVYCTLDQAIVAKAEQIFTSANPEVIITYGSVNAGSSESGNVLAPLQGCAYMDDKTLTVYRIINLEAAPATEQ